MNGAYADAVHPAEAREIPMRDVSWQEGTWEDRWLTRYILWLPLLWVAGLQVPLALLLQFAFLGRIPARRYLTDPFVLAWWAVAGMQAISALVNWAGLGVSPVFLFQKLIAATVMGWFSIGACVAIGRHGRLTARAFIRQASILGLYVLVLGVVALACYLVTGEPTMEFLTPIGRLLPDMPAVSFHFTAVPFTSEDLMDVMLPRLRLFHPWVLVLSFACIGQFHLSRHEWSRRWKYLGMAGALVGLVASFGRAAYVAFAASILYLLFARQPSGRKWLLVSIASTSLLFVLALPGLRLADMASETYRGMMDARSGSSRARQMVYDESWAATQEAPLLGHGWMGEDISEKVPIPVGSHSCFYGILYTGGAMTFAAFCLAALLTFGGLAARAGLDPLRQGAAATFLSLLVLAYGELICGFSYTTMPILFWVGMALRPAADEAGPDAMANAPETP